MFDAFFRIYRNKVGDLVRAVTGGSGILPEGELQADLLSLATREAASAAQDVLTMCLRAFEYLPPVDVTFGDYLRAIITADFELNPRDDFERRASFIDAFRARGIYAPAVTSLAEEALRLGRPPELEKETLHNELITRALASQFDIYVPDGQARRREIPRSVYPRLTGFAKKHASALQLDPRLPIQTAGIHPSFHVDENGQLLVELVAQWIQTPPAGDPQRVEVGGVALRAGTTAVFAADGRVRYIATRPLPGRHLRNDTQKRWPGDGSMASGVTPRPWTPSTRCNRGAIRNTPTSACSGGPASPSPTKALPPGGAVANTVRVRMYNVGFGDCFVLEFPREDQPPFRILVDCGAHRAGYPRRGWTPRTRCARSSLTSPQRQRSPA